MKSIRRCFLLFWGLTLLLFSCSKADAPSTDKETDNTNEETTPYDGYTLVLDESQVPSNAGYASDTDAPPAKLIAISSTGEVIKNVLHREGLDDPMLGYGCSIQRIKDHYVIFADKKSLKDDSFDKLVTVINDQTLKVVHQTAFKFMDGSYIYDFAVAISPELAVIGSNGYELHSLNLKNGEIKKIGDISYDEYSGGQVSYNGELFLYNSESNTIDIYDVNDLSKHSEIKMPEYISRVRVVDEEYIIALTNKNGGKAFLISLKDKMIKSSLTIDLSKLFISRMTYDAKTNRQYAVGQEVGIRNIVYYFDLNESTPTRNEFFIIPEEDINKEWPTHGNIRVGINHVRNEIYVGYLAKQDFVPNPNEPGNLRAIAIGYLSTISIDKHGNQLPITKTDSKVQFNDMGGFSPFFYNSKR